MIVLIFGGLAAASTMLGSKWVEGTEVQSAKLNIETIEKAIDAYARLNQRLPCPGLESVASTDSNFGKEAANAGTCTGATDATNETVRGVVPFQTLGIGKNLAYDPWGHRITYYVDKRMTAEDAMVTNPQGSTGVGDIEVQDIAGQPRTNKAVFALVSFGARAHGARNRQGNLVTNTAPSGGELKNADVDTSGGSTGANRVLVQAMAGADPNDGNEFDDIVAYKLRSQLGNPRANAVARTCAAQTVNWAEGAYGCSGSVGELIEGESVIVSDLTLQEVGSVTVLCGDDGSLHPSNEDCAHQPVNCSSGSVSWTVGGTTCSATAPATNSGDVTPQINNTASGRTGTASFTCSEGVFGVNTGAVCGLDCAAGTRKWPSLSTGPCTQSFGVMDHGQNLLLTDNTLVDTGNVTLTCSNGVISQSGASCSAGGCNGATLSWGSGGQCVANVSGPEVNGVVDSLTNTASGYTGSATATCTAGAWVISNATCDAHCSAQTVNWTVSGQTCSSSVGALSDGSSSALNDAAPNSTGSVTVTCDNGTLNQSGATCVTSCSARSEAWTVSGKTCNGSTPALNNGQSASVSDAASPTTGSVTMTCNNGVLSQSGASCISSCATRAESWVVGANTCNGTTPALNDGQSATVSDAANPTTGSVTMTCNNGTLNQSAKSCVASCAGRSENWTVVSDSCNGTTPALNDGQSTTVTDGTGPATGSVTISCNNGALSQSAQSCTSATSGCNTWTKTHRCGGLSSWNGPVNGTHNSIATQRAACGAWCESAGATCCTYSCNWTADIPDVNSPCPGIGTCSSIGTTPTASAGYNNEYAGGCTGAPPPADCSARSESWTVGSNTCIGSTPALTDGQSTSVPNTAGGYSGSVTMTCNNGALSQSAKVCSAAPLNCAGRGEMWGSGCSGTTPALGDSTSTSVPNTASGYSGSVTMTCNNGVLSQSGATCSGSCAGTSYAGFCWYLGAPSQSCLAVCSTHGGSNMAGTKDYAGSGGTNASCLNVLHALGVAGPMKGTNGDSLGCYRRYPHVTLAGNYRGTVATVETGAVSNVYRACACNN